MPYSRKRIGFIFQQFNLLPVLTAKENIIMPLLLDKQKPDVDELQNIKTAIHEIAHATLHDIDKDALERPDRRTREVQAESRQGIT